MSSIKDNVNDSINFDYYTVKCITPKGNIYIGQTIVPRIRNAVQYTVDNYKNDLFCKEIIGVAHGYIADANSSLFKSVKMVLCRINYQLLVWIRNNKSRDNPRFLLFV